MAKLCNSPSNSLILLFAIMIMLLSKVTADSNCGRHVMKDLETKVRSHQINGLRLQDSERNELARRCEKICKDCPHEGGKMCK